MTYEIIIVSILCIMCTGIIGAILAVILGKENFDEVKIALVFWLIGVCLVLPVKFTNNLISIFGYLYLLSFWITVVCWIWMFRVMDQSEMVTRKGMTLFLCFLLTIGSLYIHLPSYKERFEKYESKYNKVAKEFFYYFDKNEYGEYKSFDMDYDGKEIKESFSDSTIKNLKILDNNADLSDFCISKDAIYFFNGAGLQDVSGIVIYRNSNIVKSKENLKDELLEQLIQSPDLEKIKGNAYYFLGGR